MANIYDMVDVWNDINTTFTSIKMNVTDTASNANSLLMDLQVDSVSKFTIDKDGDVNVVGTLNTDYVEASNVLHPFLLMGV